MAVACFLFVSSAALAGDKKKWNVENPGANKERFLYSE